jgi:5-(carboxyamino)imidazole ribonucleotide synthase
MFCAAAQAKGYKVHTYSPDSDSPTGQIADKEIVGNYTDIEALTKFAKQVDIVTLEFENIPSASVEAIASLVEVRPSPEVLATFQHRLREKEFLKSNGIPVAEFSKVYSLDTLENAVAAIGYPSVLKTAGFGYDGKGQTKLKSAADLEQVKKYQLGDGYVLEKFISFDKEVSLVAARDESGEFKTFPLVENVHTNHILDYSLIPARTSERVRSQTEEITKSIFTSLKVIGVMCVEFFVVGDGVIVNEVAPRPHNSGHFSIDACVTSQFEQQLRAVTGIGLGETTLKTQAAMVNILGDIYTDGRINAAAKKDYPDVKLHLYGKKEPRIGRKMGHLTAVGENAEQCLKRALEMKGKL